MTRSSAKLIESESIISPDKHAEADAWDAGVVWGNQLFVGSLQAARDGEALQTRGISNVLTMAGGLRVWADENSGTGCVERPACVQHHLQINISDHTCADLLSALPPAIRFLDLHLAKPNSKVLVHCASGVSRSVSTCIAWLLVRQGLTLDQALTQLRMGRPNGSPNMGFHLQLQQLERNPHDLLACSSAFRAQLSGSSLLDTVRTQRERANDLFARADALEKAVCHAEPGEKLQLLQEILELQGDAMAAKGDSGEVLDRPAKTIIKSVCTRIDQMMAEIREPCIQGSVCEAVREKTR